MLLFPLSVLYLCFWRTSKSTKIVQSVYHLQYHLPYILESMYHATYRQKRSWAMFFTFGGRRYHTFQRQILGCRLTMFLSQPLPTQWRMAPCCAAPNFSVGPTGLTRAWCVVPMGIAQLSPGWTVGLSESTVQNCNPKSCWKYLEMNTRNNREKTKLAIKRVLKVFHLWTVGISWLPQFASEQRSWGHGSVVELAKLLWVSKPDMICSDKLPMKVEYSTNLVELPPNNFCPSSYQYLGITKKNTRYIHNDILYNYIHIIYWIYLVSIIRVWPVPNYVHKFHRQISWIGHPAR